MRPLPVKKAPYFLSHAVRVLIAALMGLSLLATSLAAQDKQTINNKSTPARIILTEEESRWLRDNAPLRVGMMDAWAPISFVDAAGTPQGVSVDITKSLASKLGVDVQFFPGKWSDRYEETKQGELDVILDITPKEERKPFFLFTKPYLAIPHVIIGRVGGATFEQEEDLIGYKLALEEAFYNTSYYEENFPGIEVVVYPDTEAALEAVSEGEADAYVGNRAVAIHLMGKQLLNNLTIYARREGEPTVLAFGVRKSAPILHDLLQRALDQTDVNALLNKWVDVDEGTSQLELSQSEKSWLREHPELRLGIDAHWPPFEFINSKGEYSGISRGFVEALEKRLGITMKIGPMRSWEETLAAIRDKELDLAPMVTPNPRRAEEMLFTRPYITFPAVIITRQDANYIHSIKDLVGEKVAVGRGYITHEALVSDHPDIEPYPVESVAEALQAVGDDTVSAALVNLAAYTYEVNRFNITNLKVAAPTEYSYDLAMAVRNDWPELVQILDKALNSIDDTARAAIKNRWINVNYEFGIESSKVFYWGGSIAAALLFIIAWVYYWNRLLSRKVDEREAVLKKKAHELEERVKEQTCLYTFSSLTERLDLSIPQVMDEAVKILPPGWQYPGETEAEICYQDYCARTDHYRETKWRQEAPVMVRGEHAGYIKVVYLNPKPDLDEGPFLNEERDLINELAKQLGVAIERRLDTEALRAVNLSLEQKVAERTAELEKAQIQNRLILDSAGEGIFGLTRDHTVSFCNRTAADMLGYEIQEMLGKDIHDSVHYAYPDGTEYPADQCRMRKAQELGDKLYVDDEVLWRKDGSSFPVEYSAVPMYQNNQIVGSVIVFKDISERKAAEEELCIAKEVAEAATRAKSDFLANMSHEIRTPMNAIIGMCHLALKTELTPKQHDYLRKIDMSAKSLLEIINDILDFSKIEAGKLTVEKVDFRLENVLENLSNLVTVKAEEKGLELLFKVDRNVPRNLRGDPLRIGQVLINLCSNAVKFTDEGEIIVNIEMQDKIDGDAVIKFSVTDTGIGLTEEQIDRLFQAFNQADSSTTRKFGGTGLGLSISKKLSELMGGSIGVESTYGQGSTFWFTARLGEAELKQTFTAGAEVLRNKRALVVDDNFAAQEVFQDYLDLFGFTVDCAENGEQALKLVEEKDVAEPYDLILMDWKMPVMDGLEAAKRIKTSKTITHKPPIIIVTSFGREELMLKAEQIGLEGFLVKPVTHSALFDAIANIFKVKGYRNEILKQKKSGSEYHELWGAKILLAEDNEINQQIARELLEEHQIEVDVAENGQVAYKLVQQSHYDGVLMDLQMPIMDGLEATRHIRSLGGRFGTLPIIAMTANVMAGDRDQAFEAGMNDHISKPIDVVEMFQTMQKHIVPANPVVTKHIRKTDRVKMDGLPDNLNSVNIGEGLARLSGNTELYLKLLARFYDSEKDFPERFDAALRSDQKEAIRLAHTLKGVAGNLGARDLERASSALEKVTRDGSENQDASIVAVINELKRVLDEIKPLIAVEDGGGETTNGPVGKPSRFDDLARLLSQGDTEAYALAEASLQEANDEYRHALKKILNCLNEFDFDAALKVVRDIEEKKG